MNAYQFGDRFAMLERPEGRWILVHPDDFSLAWVGFRWAAHEDGVWDEGPVPNFQTIEAATAYGAGFFKPEPL
jgi:hypothetical protein